MLESMHILLVIFSLEHSLICKNMIKYKEKCQYVIDDN